MFTPNSSINWESAQSQCKLRGGSLASIRSEPEEKFLLNLMTHINTTCLIGLNDRSREAGTNPNRYAWEDGSRSIYRHFRNEVGTLNRDCVALSLEYGSWINADCNDFYTCYICRGTGKSCIHKYKLIVLRHNLSSILKHNALYSMYVYVCVYICLFVQS